MAKTELDDAQVCKAYDIAQLGLQYLPIGPKEDRLSQRSVPDIRQRPARSAAPRVNTSGGTPRARFRR